MQLFKLALLMVLLSGCNVLDYFQHTPRNLYVVVVLDTTFDRNAPTSVARFVENQLRERTDLTDNYASFYDGVTVEVIPITGTMYSSPQQITLPPVSSMIEVNEAARLTETKTFFTEELPEIFATATTMTGDTAHTWLYKPLLEHLRQPLDTAYTETLTYLFTDALENGAVSFYPFRTNPDGIMQSYGTLSERFIEHYGVCPPLEGRTLTLVHTPSVKDQYLFDQSRQFFERFIKEHGGIPVYKPAPAPTITANK